MENKLAIVIPYYKSDYFKELLDSLNNQTNKKFNLYIGNDNSPNNPNQILNEYNNIITDYKCYDSNLGNTYLNNHWNRCIDDLVRDEEWIMLLCDDDLLELDVIDTFYSNLESIVNNNCNVVRYSTRVVNQNNSIVLKEFRTINVIEDSIFLFKQKLLEQTRSSLSEYIFSKSSYDKHKFKSFNLSFGSDNVAWLEFSDFKEIYCINNSFVRYRSSEFSVSGNQNLKKGKILGEIEYLRYLINHYEYKFSENTLYILYERYYHYYRSLNRKNDINTLKIILKMLVHLGLMNTFKILKYNKNYFQRFF